MEHTGTDYTVTGTYIHRYINYSIFEHNTLNWLSYTKLWFFNNKNINNKSITVYLYDNPTISSVSGSMSMS